MCLACPFHTVLFKVLFVFVVLAHERRRILHINVIVVLLVATAVLLGSGCQSVGPGTIKRDRLHYATAVADSWKEQLLLNIVKMRYADAPAFLEVVSVVSGYSLETGVSLLGQFSPEPLRGDTFVGGGLSGRFTDRPTISYSPLTGEKFTRNLMAPVPLDALMFVIQGEHPPTPSWVRPWNKFTGRIHKVTVEVK